MKLLDDFFEVQQDIVSGKGLVATIKLNPDHVIYAGHFPGYPVTPGVVQLQIVQELLEKRVGVKLKLLTMPQCKFVKILNPNDAPCVRVQIEFNRAGDLLDVKAWIENGADMFFKMQATYQVAVFF